MDNPKTAVIFRSRMLPFSETFIKAQADSLKRYEPVFLGIRRVPGVSLAGRQTLFLSDGDMTGYLRELRFRAFGPSPRQIARLRTLAGRVFHAHFATDACDALELVRMLQIPLICTCHGYDVSITDAGHTKHWHGRMYLRRRSKLQRETSVFIAVSHYIRLRMLEQAYPEDRIKVHYIGVDTALFQPPAVNDRQPHVLFVGRLTEKKGCAYLIDAMSSVQARHPNAELLIIGDGPERASLETKARDSLRRVRFLGKQKPEAILRFMQTASILCVPSIRAANGDAEGFGMVFAEAQACELPVVSFASGGIPEAVLDGETGILAPERDVQALTRALLLLLESPTLVQKFGRAGRVHVKRNFDLEKQSRLLETIYDEVSSGAKGRAID